MRKASQIKSDSDRYDYRPLLDTTNKRLDLNNLIRRIKDEEKKQPYRAPELGEHSKEILSSLGMDEDKINKLKENGVIEF